MLPFHSMLSLGSCFASFSVALHYPENNIKRGLEIKHVGSDGVAGISEFFTEDGVVFALIRVVRRLSCFHMLSQLALQKHFFLCGVAFILRALHCGWRSPLSVVFHLCVCPSKLRLFILNSLPNLMSYWKF